MPWRVFPTPHPCFCVSQSPISCFSEMGSFSSILDVVDRTILCFFETIFVLNLFSDSTWIHLESTWNQLESAFHLDWNCLKLFSSAWIRLEPVGHIKVLHFWQDQTGIIQAKKIDSHCCVPRQWWYIIASRSSFLSIASLGELAALARLSKTGMYVKVMWTNLMIWCQTDARKLYRLYLLRKATTVPFLMGLLCEWSLCAAYIYCHKVAPLS